MVKQGFKPAILNDGRFKLVAFAIKEGCPTARNPVEEQGKFAPSYETFGRLMM